MPLFDLPQNNRVKLWQELSTLLESYYAETSKLKVAPQLDPKRILELASKYDFTAPVSAREAVNHVVDGIKKYGVQVSHPLYFGLFNPRPNFASIMADMIIATLNPQIAAWSHSPFAAECENFLVGEFGKKFGFPADSIDGVFCGGGAEANHTAVLCAINAHLPAYAKEGLKSSSKDLKIYCSKESHHSIGKAAMMTGLGRDAVVEVEADQHQRMIPEQLEREIRNDLEKGQQPFLIVATTGTTGSGAIDPVPEISQITSKFKLWLHVDAAYGGAAILNDASKKFLKGIEKADSITFDMHKWMSVPMGTSIFLTQNKDILFRTFRITTEYMPHDADGLDIVDPYIHSMQWSRRFVGLRTYLSLLIFGWDGYSETIAHQVQMGNYLRAKLKEDGWVITNETKLPVVCFSDPSQLENGQFATRMCEKVLESGNAWLSVYKVNQVNSLRACITNYATQPSDLEQFVSLLNDTRNKLN